MQKDILTCDISMHHIFTTIVESKRDQMKGDLLVGPHTTPNIFLLRGNCPYYFTLFIFGKTYLIFNKLRIQFSWICMQIFPIQPCPTSMIDFSLIRVSNIQCKGLMHFHLILNYLYNSQFFVVSLMIWISTTSKWRCWMYEVFQMTWGKEFVGSQSKRMKFSFQIEV